MTVHQVLIVACIGGLAALLGVAAIVLLGVAVYTAVPRVIDAHDAHRARRRDLKTIRAINALGPARTDNAQH